MKALLFLIVGSLLAAVACTNTSNENIETWWINSAKMECTGEASMYCLQIQKGKELNAGSWEFFYSDIEGFEYEPGNIYQIKVRLSDKEAPLAADASSKNYELVDILSKKVDLALRITNTWKVIEVGDIKNPTSFQTNEALRFEFDASKKTYTGDMGCNMVQGAIQENDVEKLIFETGAATLMACPDMAVEQAISKALLNTRKYTLENNQLLLLDEAGLTLMIFQAID